MPEHEQLSFSTGHEASDDPVVCLGLTFKNDDERRAYFREELRKKLPELKQIEGFPIGEDEDIIALSDPPYYTACPNPWVNSFIEEWEKEKITNYGRDLSEEYDCEPFAADVSEGKGNSIYNAHSYHTKVPHKAIMRYLAHYTKPGDIVIDGFSGSGMTGIASQLMGSKHELESMGYFVEDGFIYDENKLVGEIGVRHGILNDLSPAASFLSYSYNYKENPTNYLEDAQQILMKLLEKYRWLIETNHSGEKKGLIKYTLWSDIYLCSTCSNEINFWEHGIDHVKGLNKDMISCPACETVLNKKNLERSKETYIDLETEEIIERAKQIPVLINYTYNGSVFSKIPDEKDLSKIKEIENLEISNWIPTSVLEEGVNTSQPIKSHGLTRVHHFYTKRNLILLSALYEHCDTTSLKFLFTGLLTRSSKQARFLTKNYFHGGGGWVGTSLSGTLFIPSLSVEVNPLFTFENRFKKSIDFEMLSNNVISTQATQNISQINDNSIDYIFTDPPFGSNLMYSELNYNLESWIKVKTNSQSEAIVNTIQRKALPDYQNLMESCFKEYFRILKPNRWITVEFSNSKSSVWNAIQEAILRSGFVIANVAALDKKQGSFKAVTSTTAVKQDLVISAYKPSEENINRMREQINTPDSAWTFTLQHLGKLPIFQGSKGEASMISERTPRILFDRMVAYHVQNGLPVPISSADFQSGVARRFPIRDGMAFLDSQVAEYDKNRMLVKEFSQMDLFVSDENSAIEWIRQNLLRKPQTRQELHTEFMKEIQHIAKHEKLPELDDLLAQNFLRYDNEPEVPSQIVSYFRRNYPDLRGLESTDRKIMQKAINRWYVPDPNKQADLEKLREKSLLREFTIYVDEMTKSKKKLKEFRTESIRAGFKKAWSEKDYQTIVDIGNRLPETVIQEDDKLLMYFDNAQIKLGL